MYLRCNLQGVQPIYQPANSENQKNFIAHPVESRIAEIDILAALQAMRRLEDDLDSFRFLFIFYRMLSAQNKTYQITSEPRCNDSDSRY